MHAPINECVVAGYSVFITATLSTNCILHVHTCIRTILHTYIYKYVIEGRLKIVALPMATGLTGSWVIEVNAQICRESV